MNISQTTLGTFIETEHVQALLGNKNSTLKNLQQHFPKLNFKTLKQVHGDAILKTTDADPNSIRPADAHWTDQSNLAICSISADCVPVLIYSHQPRFIMAIHAGWRGVAQRIIPKAIKNLISMKAAPENLSILIGPHIQMPSFEVENDVRDQLLACVEQPEAFYSKPLNDKKSLVDLNALVKAQLAEFNCSAENIFCEFIDTKTNSNYHSARRDKEHSGRQISWIALK